MVLIQEVHQLRRTRQVGYAGVIGIMIQPVAVLILRPEVVAYSQHFIYRCLGSICQLVRKRAYGFEFIILRHEGVILHELAVYPIIICDMAQQFKSLLLEFLVYRCRYILYKISAVQYRYIALCPVCRFELIPEILLYRYRLYKVAHIRGQVGARRKHLVVDLDIHSLPQFRPQAVADHRRILLRREQRDLRWVRLKKVIVRNGRIPLKGFCKCIKLSEVECRQVQWVRHVCAGEEVIDMRAKQQLLASA